MRYGQNRPPGYLPHENPCAQCGKPIAAPDWIENGPRRISYLWHCQACDYRFEAVAFFDASHPGGKLSRPDGTDPRPRR